MDGGAGNPAGAAYADAQPVALPLDLHLTVTPTLANAQGKTFFASGETVGFSMTTGAASTAMVIAFDVDVPSPGLFLAIDPSPLIWVPGNAIQGTIPTFLPAVPGIEVYVQGFTLDSGEVLLSETASARIDLGP